MMRHTWIGIAPILALARLGLGATTTAIAPVELEQRIAHIEKTVEATFKDGGAAGMALAVVMDDRPVLLRGYGWRDVERKLPVTGDTLFAIGSTTKAFTAMLAVMSQDEGTLSLGDPPRKFLPYFKLLDEDADAKVTLRDLLCHRSGLMRTDLLWMPGVLTREQVIRAAAGAKPTAKLGAAWQYQNVMFSAAGEAVAAARKTTWEEDLRARLLEPLGMRGSNTSIDAMRKSSDYATGYTLDHNTKQVTATPMRDLTSIGPAGAINSSARDMAQWLRLMLGRGQIDGKRLASEKAFSQLVWPQMAMSAKMDYGLGWILWKWNGHSAWEHGGGIDGFSALVSLLPEQKIGVVILVNVAGANLGALVRETVWTTLIEGIKPATASAPASGPTVAPQKEAGLYQMGAVLVEVVFADGQLSAIVPGQNPYKLAHLVGRRYKFADPQFPGFFVTFRPVKGNEKETEMLMEQPQGSFVLRRATTRPTTSTKPAVDVDELMAKVIQAAGGEAAIRKHKSRLVSFQTTLENQGVVGEGTAWAKAPHFYEQRVTLKAMGKTLAVTELRFDGAVMRQKFDGLTADISGPKDLAVLKALYQFHQPLDWRNQYRTIVAHKDKLDGADVLAVAKTPADGAPIVDHYSAATHLLTRRVYTQPAGPMTPPETRREDYDDYRAVDGVQMPHRITLASPLSVGTIVMRVTEVKFDVEPASAPATSPKD